MLKKEQKQQRAAEKHISKKSPLVYSIVMINQGDILTVKIESLSNEGEGIAHAGEERFVLFVTDALPGEEAEVRVVTRKKSYGTAKVLKRLTTSKDRITPVCPSFGRCGGCQLQHLEAAAQLTLKEKTVRDALERIGGLQNPVVLPCEPSPRQLGYRNKASVPVQSQRGDGINAGFYKKRSHEIIPFRSCQVLDPELEKILSQLLNLLRAEGFRGIREGAKPAPNELLRHVVMRRGTFSGETLCAVITNRMPTPAELTSLKKIAKKIPTLGGLVCNINTAPGNFIWGHKTIEVSGSSIMTEKLGKYTFTFEASSFFQVNSAQALKLYEYASSLALAYKPERILELYSGVGSLTAFLASQGAEVTAVESWLPAAKYIKTNSEQNGIKTIKHFAAEAEEIAEKLSDQHYDVIVVDPPRTGCDEKVINAIAKMAPAKIIYVSCNPATLARDTARLSALGYQLKSAKPFDMFPETGHVETVVLMSRVNN